MKQRRVLYELCVLVVCLCAGRILWPGEVGPQPQQSGGAPPPGRKPKAPPAKLPLSFETNQGQTDKRVKFISHGRGYGVFLTGDELVLEVQELGETARRPGARSSVPRATTNERRMTDNGPRARDNKCRSVLRLKLLNANQHAAVSGVDELPGKANYFIGNDPKKWRTDVPTYARVKYQGVYPGIDLVYYGDRSGQLEYDFVVSPGADPGSIQFAIDANGQVGSGQKAIGRRKKAVLIGARPNAATSLASRHSSPVWSQPIIDSSGDLVLSTVNGTEVRFLKPLVYQEQELGVESRETEGKDNNRRSRITHRQASIVHREYRAGRFVLDAQNHVHLALGPYDRTRPLVIDPVLYYSTNLGDNSGAVGTGIAVDSSGSAYVTVGNYVQKLNGDGSALVYSTYLGDSNDVSCLGIAIDSSGNAYVTGETGSEDFPTVNPFQPTNKAAATISGEVTAFVAKLNSSGSALVFSTYLGGSTQDYGYGIAVDSSGSAYVTGWTLSTDFPTAHPFQATCNGCAGGGDAFVTKFNPAGTALVYSTFLGGSASVFYPYTAISSVGASIAVDSSGNAYVTGQTRATDFPTVNPFQATNLAPGGTAFVSKFNAAGSALLFSTYLGGSNTENGAGIAVDSSGNAYVTGSTNSTDFPTVNPLQTSLSNIGYAFVTKLNASGSGLVYSTYLGGSTSITPYTSVNTAANSIAVDSSGNAYVTGETDATDFPVVNPIQSSCPACSAGSGNAFLAELNPAGSALVYSTYLGGSFFDNGNGIAVDSSGNTYVTGENDATDFPGSPPLPANPEGIIEPFVVKIAGSPAPGPGVTLSTRLLPFLNEPVGTTSSNECVILRSVGADPLNIVNISASGDFGLVPTRSSCPYSGGTVASGAVCTIDITFTPTETGARNGTIAIFDNAGDSPQSVSLNGTGVVSGPQAVVSPTTLTFGSQWMNVVSPPQPITLSNTGNAPLTIASIAMPGMFSQTNNCGNSVAASSSCTINVTFAPTYDGPLPGTLFITDNSNGIPNSTQSVSLNGAYQDFEISFVSASPSSLDLSPGQSGSYTWAVTSVGGFNHSVDFSCSLVAAQGFNTVPTAATCTVSPAVATPTTTPTNVTVIVTIPASSASGLRTLPPPQSRLPGPQILLILAALLATAAWKVREWKRAQASGRRTSLVLLVAGSLLAIGLAGCGGGGGGGIDPPVVHTTGTYYTVAVTGTATSGSATLTNMSNIQIYVPE